MWEKVGLGERRGLQGQERVQVADASDLDVQSLCKECHGGWHSIIVSITYSQYRREAPAGSEQVNWNRSKHCNSCLRSNDPNDPSTKHLDPYLTTPLSRRQSQPCLVRARSALIHLVDTPGHPSIPFRSCPRDFQISLKTSAPYCPPVSQLHTPAAPHSPTAQSDMTDAAQVAAAVPSFQMCHWMAL